MASSEINVKAFLKLIRFAEHKRDDDGIYYILYGGSTFTDTSKHPNKAMTAWGRTSTAAGAYQILYRTWKEAFDQGLVSDFTPASQDLIARHKLKTRKALKSVEAGNIEDAIGYLRSEWTSVPGATQSNFSITDARKKFNQYVAELTIK